MRIGELSRRTGVSIRLLRYYEEQGLLAPVRLPSGYREYQEEDVATVRGIRTLLGAGLGTATIARLLPCMVDDGDSLAPGCHGLLPDLHQERERIDEAVASLLAAREALDSIIATPVPAPPAAGAADEPDAVSDPPACVVPDAGPYAPAALAPPAPACAAPPAQAPGLPSGHVHTSGLTTGTAG